MNEGKIIHIEYNKDKLQIKRLNDVQEIGDMDRDKVNWIDISSLEYTDIIKEMAEKFKLHPLVLKDILNVGHIPKLEDYEGYLFLIIKDVNYEDNKLKVKQISLILFENIVLSFQESGPNLYDDIIISLKEGASIRKNGADDLLYVLIDKVIDNYFEVIELIGREIDIIEDEVLLNPGKEVLDNIYNLKKNLIYMRKILWPMRNAINDIIKNEYDLIDKRTIYYFRGIYNHIIQILDMNETYREICIGVLDTYLSSVGNKTNDIMKILTIYSTIFIPLSFIAGVYGMNFKYFPELNWKYSYLGFWLITLIMIGVMLRFFKKKNWI